MKLIAVLIFQFLFLNPIDGQTIENPEKLKQEVKKQAEKMLKYFFDKKYNSFASYTLLSLIEKMGGQDKMINEISQGMRSMEKDGFSFLSGTIGD